ncbi:Nucleotidyltransferase [Wolfiporia cocos MD-104 SS10]|uniref:polynucleotide adenylyltransferase n=1 Tax=Wolfiporia cocos (strain MD-104) TaxID=742152 RepID=A0A2H3IY75_WOLCO|nr:Nucleotidyltransferase [Wolfiporia cocos MD-104 SS10]
MAEGTTWPWTASLGALRCDSKEQRLHEEVIAYVSYITPSTQERSAREQVIARIVNLTKARFANSTLATFGSTVHDLYLPDGDVDLVMSLPRELDEDTRRRTLFQLSALLKNALVTQHVTVVLRARVPVISFETVPELGSFSIDISINATDGVNGVPVVANYLRTMPALRYLVMIVKEYLSRLKLNSASNSGLSSYSVILLAVSFLQRNPKKRPQEDIDNPLPRESLGRLLLDFFEHYGFEFDYEDACVSVLQRKLLTKEEKNWERPSHPGALSIECPVNPENDVGRPTGKINQIQKAFQDAYVALRDYPFSMAQPNVLGTIVGVAPVTLERRAHLCELVDSGSLARALREVRAPEPPQRGQRNAPFHHNSYSRNHHSRGSSSHYHPYGNQSAGMAFSPHLGAHSIGAVYDGPLRYDPAAGAFEPQWTGGTYGPHGAGQSPNGSNRRGKGRKTK